MELHVFEVAGRVFQQGAEPGFHRSDARAAAGTAPAREPDRPDSPNFDGEVHRAAGCVRQPDQARRGPAVPRTDAVSQVAFCERKPHLRILNGVSPQRTLDFILGRNVRVELSGPPCPGRD